jgi:hypothetical protein
MYPLGYIEDFFVKADAVAAPISPPAAEGTFEMGSTSNCSVYRFKTIKREMREYA